MIGKVGGKHSLDLKNASRSSETWKHLSAISLVLSIVQPLGGTGNFYDTNNGPRNKLYCVSFNRSARSARALPPDAKQNSLAPVAENVALPHEPGFDSQPKTGVPLAP